MMMCLIQENEALQAQLEEMRAAPAPLAAAQATRDEAAADRTNWQRHIEAFQVENLSMFVVIHLYFPADDGVGGV